MNYYQVLDIPTNSSIEIIKRKYRRLALIYHPDKVDGLVNKRINSEKFIEITEAYTILSHPSTKQKYDWQNNIGSSYDNIDVNINRDTYNETLDDLISPILKSFGFETSDILEKLGIKNEHIRKFTRWISLDREQANKIFQSALNDVYGKIIDKNNMDNKQDSIITEYRNIVIDFELEDHYNGDFIKTLQLTVGNNIHTIEIDSSISIHNIELLLDNVFYILDVKCVPSENELFSIRQDKDISDLYHTIYIPLSAFINGFYYTLDIFGTCQPIFFRTPYNTNLIYKMPNYGNIKSSNTNMRGNIFFLLKLNTISNEQLVSLSIIDINSNTESIEADALDLSLFV